MVHRLTFVARRFWFLSTLSSTATRYRDIAICAIFMPPTLHDPHGNQPAAAALTQLHILMPHNTRLPTD